MKRSFEVYVPWRLGSKTPFNLTVHDRNLLRSENHFLRFDVYPLFAPAHPERHFGYWDLPMRMLKREHTKLVLRDRDLMVPNKWRYTPIKRAWNDDVELTGYCRLVVSLWDSTTIPPVQVEKQFSVHLVLSGHQDLPLEYLLLPITQRCNLTCPACPRQSATGLEASDLPPDVLEGVLEAAPQLVYVGLQGLGEPLLNRDIFGIADKLRRRMPLPGRLALTTNGSMLDRQAAARLIDCGLNTFTFSIDGASKLVYEGLRVGASFDKVISNIAQAIEYGKSSGRRDLWFTANFVVMKDNLHEIPEFAKLAGSLGLDAISLFNRREYPSGDSCLIEEEVLAPLLDEAAETATRNNMILQTANPNMSRGKACYFMQTAYLWLSGEVLPCHRMEPPGHPWPIKIFGNVRKGSLLEIWNRPEYRAFRSRVITGDLPDVCRGCNFCDSCAI